MAVAKKKQNKTARIREFMKTNERFQMTVPEMVDELKKQEGMIVSPGYIYGIRNRDKYKKVKHKPGVDGMAKTPIKQVKVAQDNEQLTIGLPIHKNGTVVKLTHKKRSVATVIFREDGFQFKGANKKKDHGRTVTWKQLDSLFLSGLLG